MRYAVRALLGAFYFATSAASATQTHGGTGITLSPAAATIGTPTFVAKGRTGSHRVGGTNSHGKGSHYSGGRK